MRKSKEKPRNARRAGIAAIAAAIACLWALGAAPAQGSPLELTGYFGGVLAEPVPPGNFPEEEQLGGTGGMAVNYTGAGGVEPGTVYVATIGPSQGTVRIAMFVPQGEGLKFSLGWEVTEAEGAYKRCGPDLEPPSVCPVQAEAPEGKIDVDVDQSTGNVYAYNGASNAGDKTIVVYTPKGAGVITRFGEKVPQIGNPVPVTADKIHLSPYPGMLAVNGSGEVFVFDENNLEGFYARVMRFRPKVPGIYSEYEYAGIGEDLAGGKGSEPTAPVVDAAGMVYVLSKNGDTIWAYDSAQPGDPAVCTFKPPKGGVTAITVNPIGGELFYFSYRKETGFSFKTVHELGPCDKGTGKFGAGEQIAQIEVKPERDDIWGLAFDPVRKLSPLTPAGVLYGAAPGAEPSSGVGKGQPGFGSLGYIFAPAEESPPKVEAQSVTKVGASSAQLHAVIAPNGFKTHFVFQYLSKAAYEGEGESFSGAAEAPVGGAFLPGTGEAQGAAVTLTGLAPDTEYVYRAVASSVCSKEKEEKEEECVVAGAAQGFKTYPPGTAGPPDGRVWELVSPAQKSGGQVLPADPGISSCGFECKPGSTYEHFPMQSAPDGDAVAYEGLPFATGSGAAIENEYVARRSATGWQSTNPTPALLQGKTGYRAFDPELEEGVLEQGSPTLSPAAPPGYGNLYAQSVADPLAPAPLVGFEPNRPADEFQINFAGAAEDLSRVFFNANAALTVETPFAPEPPDPGVSKFNLYEWERASGQLRLVNVAPGNAATQPGASFGSGSAHTISADGSRAFFSGEAGQVFVREDAEVTREIPGSGPSAKFLAAATDGSRVLLSNGHLYDLEAEEAIDLSGGKGGFQGLVGQGDDLSHAYFVDTAVLSGEEENSEGDKAQAGKDNLYGWSEGTTRFVATLAAGDNSIFAGGDWVTSPASRTAKASPNGRFVAFLSQAQLSGYDNSGPCEADGAGGLVDAPCPEAFLYDFATGELECASCNPSGALPLGWSVLRQIDGPQTLAQADYLTDSGRLFFDSEDSLSPFDTNEGAEDVYEFKPEGIDGCEHAGGCVALISAGREGADSNFLAADPSGDNVFFTTRDRLVGADTDDLIDLYDARVEGGFPGESELPPMQCQAEACQPPPPGPAELPPPSATLTDPGNVKPAKGCKKGQVKRNGKCVKKSKAKPKHKKAKHGRRK